MRRVFRYLQIDTGPRHSPSACSEIRTKRYVKWRKYLPGPWQFVGLGPPGALQLLEGTPHAGRIVVPGYHSYIRGLAGGGGTGAGVALPVSQLYNNFALGHVVYRHISLWPI